LPTGYAALGYDAAYMLLTAIGSMDSLSENLLENRTTIKNKIASIKGFEGVSGTLDMNIAGDPIKSAVVILINNDGAFESYKTETP
jgi:branched-chain amino acid transport system substrate-binding protein